MPAIASWRLAATIAMTGIAAGTGSAAAASAAAFRIVHAFANADRAAVPYSSVIARDGWLYGTTAFLQWGGSAPDKAELLESGGSVYRVRADGDGFEVLHRFSATAPSAGYTPFQGLTPVGGSLVGTTWSGGALDKGTLYAIGADGSGYQVIHEFGAGGDGRHPYAAPIAVGSVLYGTTGFGGPNVGGGDLASMGAGVLYSYDLATGTYAVEKAFDAPGANSFGTLTKVGDWLYGMVADHRNTAAFGRVFRYRPTDQAYEVVHEFTGGHGGGYPYDSLTWDGGQYLYGTTLGFYPWHPLAPLDIMALEDEGVVFRIDLGRAPSDPLHYQVLHDFALAAGDGAKPNSGMLVAPDGYLYGIAHGSEGLGGSVNGVWYGSEFGTLYRLRPDGSEFTVMHAFDSLADGFTPMRGLIWIDGTIYGTTAKGGLAVPLDGGLMSGGSGTVWSFTVSSVPEPAAIPLLLAGCLAVAAAGRRCRWRWPARAPRGHG